METSHFLAANKTANIMIGLADKRNIAMVVMTRSDADLCEALLLLLLHSHYHYHSMLAQKGLNNQTRASLHCSSCLGLPCRILDIKEAQPEKELQRRLQSRYVFKDAPTRGFAPRRQT